MIETPRLIL